MKIKLWGTALLLSLALSVSAVSFAASNKVVDIHSVKVPAGVTLQKGAQTSLLTNKQDINTYLLGWGVLDTEVYQLRYKQNNEFRYGVIADIRLGATGLQFFGIDGTMPVISIKGQKDNDAKYVAEVAEYINDNGDNPTRPYTVVTPLTKQKNGSYAGTVRVDTYEDLKTYSDTLHVVVYDNLYFGTSIRVIGLNSGDDSDLWPRLADFAKVYK
ncbi:MAG: hypothetical protein KHZ77_05095 [Veillonella sp.]|uniref:hypothetical protein n=1 Tax=Veillonella sp. TaxID=1926307 RepID=UPI0025D0A1FA|nr:hypothetical protein [Veillonella sp.]MBS4913521.1 hypothetical protein [Veillonella sp.]